MMKFLDRLQWRSFYARRMLAAHFITPMKIKSVVSVKGQK
jgi:hypothetical protein